MRTTMVIQDEIFASAKKFAAENGCSLSGLVNDALRRLLKDPIPSSNSIPFRMPTFGSRNDHIDTPPSEIGSLVEQDHLEPFSH
jgi:hypothetical protein